MSSDELEDCGVALGFVGQERLRVASKGLTVANCMIIHTPCIKFQSGCSGPVGMLAASSAL